MDSTEQLEAQFILELMRRVMPATDVLETNGILVDSPAYKAYAESTKSYYYKTEKLRPFAGAYEGVFENLRNNWREFIPNAILKERKILAAVSITESSKNIKSYMKLYKAGDGNDGARLMFQVGMAVMSMTEDLAVLSMPDYEKVVISDFQKKRKETFAQNNRDTVKKLATFYLTGPTKGVYISKSGRINLSQLARAITPNMKIGERAVINHIRELIRDDKLLATA